VNESHHFVETFSCVCTFYDKTKKRRKGCEDCREICGVINGKGRVIFKGELEVALQKEKNWH